VLRLLPDRAGVHDHEVAPLDIRLGRPARVDQEVRDLLRVVDVHLAPEGAKGEAADGHGGPSYPRRFRAAKPRCSRPPRGSARLIWGGNKPCLPARGGRAHNPPQLGGGSSNEIPSSFGSGGGYGISNQNAHPLPPHHLSTATPPCTTP